MKDFPINTSLPLKQILERVNEHDVVDYLAPLNKNISHRNFCDFFTRISEDRKWRNGHRKTTEDFICKGHELLKMEILPSVQHRRINDIVHNTLPDIKNMIRKDYYVLHPKIFNRLIDGIDNGRLDFPPQITLEKISQKMTEMLRYGLQFHVPEITTDRIMQVLREKIIDGKDAFDCRLILLQLSKIGEDVSEFEDLINKGINESIRDATENHLASLSEFSEESPLIESPLVKSQMDDDVNTLSKFLEKPQVRAFITRFATRIDVDLSKVVDNDLDTLLRILPKGLKELNLSGTSLASLNVIKKLKNLEVLKLAGCENLTDITAARNFLQLKSIDLTDCLDDNDLDTLLRILPKGLKELNLSGTNLRSLNGIKEFVNLEVLKLAGCANLTDITAVKNFSQLKSIDLTDCKALTSLPLEKNIWVTQYKLSGCEKIAFNSIEKLVNTWTCRPDIGDIKIFLDAHSTRIRDNFTRAAEEEGLRMNFN